MDFIELQELHSDKTLTPLFVTPTAVTMSKLVINQEDVHVVNFIDHSGRKYVVLTKNSTLYDKICDILHYRPPMALNELKLVAINESEISEECDDNEEKITDISLYAIYKYNQ